MTVLLAVLALNLGPVLWLRAITREVALLITVTARNVVWVARLITLFRNVVLGATVAASPRGTRLHVGTLFDVSEIRSSGSMQSLTSLEKWPVSLHFLHSTPSAERGSGHSFAL